MEQISIISGKLKFADYVRLSYFEHNLIWANLESTLLEIILQKFPKLSGKNVLK